MVKIIFENDPDKNPDKVQPIGNITVRDFCKNVPIDDRTVRDFYENEGIKWREELYEKWEEENRKLDLTIHQSKNPILIDWWEYRKKVEKEDPSIIRIANLRLSFSIFINFIQYKTKKEELKKFIGSKQDGYVSAWDQFSKVFLNSKDFLMEIIPQVTKENYLKYEKKTYQYLTNLYLGKKIPKFKNSEFFENIIQSDDYKFIHDTYFKYQVKERIESNNKSFRPIFFEANQEDIFENLKQLFSPVEEFEKLIKGKELKGKINFKGKQSKLAGIFIQLRKDSEIETGTHEETFEFIKETFFINGKSITSKQILRYLKGDTKIADSNLFIR